MKDYDLFTKRFIDPVMYKDLFDQKFGEAWREWESETLLQEIKRIWSVVPIDTVLEKLMALQLLLTTNLFWSDYLAFEKVILAFNDHYVSMGEIQACTPEELTFALELVRQMNLHKMPFEEEIRGYIQACHREAGQVFYAPSMSFAQPIYEDTWRRMIVRGVQRKIDSNAQADEFSQEDPVMVQYAKVRDCAVYTEERLKHVDKD